MEIGHLTKEMNDNLEKQKAHTEEMIRLEQSRKKPDQDKIDDWNDEIAELEQQMAENIEETFNNLTNGILENVLDASRDFVDAWYDAFKETGDGMSGLKDTFKEMLLDMIKQQAAMNVMGKYVDDYKDWLNDYVNEDDTVFTKDEAEEYAARVRETFGAVDEELEGYLGAMDEIAGQFESSELSGLQKGIQGITEDQAEVLASYWNSCRFLLANIDMTLTNVASKAFGDSNGSNSILGELKRQTEVLNRISNMLNSVIRSGGESSHIGDYIKVFDA
jgi:methyl-accepting chemotaxis protein